jgi:hypothetical protein
LNFFEFLFDRFFWILTSRAEMTCGGVPPQNSYGFDSFGLLVFDLWSGLIGLVGPTDFW